MTGTPNSSDLAAKNEGAARGTRSGPVGHRSAPAGRSTRRDYSTDIYHTMGGGGPEANSRDLAEVTKQIARDEPAHGLLNQAMNEAMIHDFQTENERPADSLNRAGRTLGFIEEARHQAIAGDTPDLSREKTLVYHSAGASVTPLPGGALFQAGVGAATEAWYADEQAAINEQTRQDQANVYELRKGQAITLAREWYQANSEWAEVRDDWSEDEGVYHEMELAVNAGNDRVEGELGDEML